jgi:hypothetical protein
VGLALARRAPREAGGGRRTVVTRTREAEGGGVRVVGRRWGGCWAGPKK